MLIPRKHVGSSGPPSSRAHLAPKLKTRMEGLKAVARELGVPLCQSGGIQEPNERCAIRFQLRPSPLQLVEFPYAGWLPCSGAKARRIRGKYLRMYSGISSADGQSPLESLAGLCSPKEDCRAGIITI